MLSAPIARPALELLTRQEAAIFEQLLAGRTYREIATARRRSRSTVANQVASILRKLGVASRRELLVAFHRAESHPPSGSRCPTAAAKGLEATHDERGSR